MRQVSEPRVASLSVVKTFETEVAEDALALAEDMTARIKSGQCTGLSLALCMKDGTVWYKSSLQVDRHKMIGILFDLMMERWRTL